MRSSPLSGRACAAIVVSLASLFPPAARACCPAWRAGAMVRIADQRILVAWDPATGIEHFVREARFSGGAAKADDFGFLVPSPTVPEIAEADGGVFDALAETSRPKIVEVTTLRTHWSLLGALFLSSRVTPASRTTDMAPMAPRAAVEVVKTARVAGYEAAVLRADDPELLGKWLADNGYQSRPELVEWSRPYVDAGWMITAFKYVGSAERVDVAAVRMSFVTEAPLFPYRVPTDQIAPEGRGHMLRAFVVGPGRAAGTLGTGDAARPWSRARVAYSRPLSADGGSAAILAGALPAGAAAAHDDAWLTTFEDDSWPSGTDDLTFAFDAAAKPYRQVVEKPVTREVLVPLDVFAVAAAGLALVSFGRRARG